MTIAPGKCAMRELNGATDDSLQPFIVVSGKLKLRFIPDTGGFAVTGVGIRGLNTQGDTFEEALANAHDAAKLLEECEKEMRSLSPSTPRKVRGGSPRRRAALAKG